MVAKLTRETLIRESGLFSDRESRHSEQSLYGVTDGKAIGTYLEHKFRAYLENLYSFSGGSSASGMDFPELNIDMKVTSLRQPQSSCPFKSARQKIYGLGYGLLIFVYEKSDDHQTRTGRLYIQHTIYIEKELTADYQMTRGVLDILERNGNQDDLIGFFADRNLPIDDIQAQDLADEVLAKPPCLGLSDDLQRPAMETPLQARHCPAKYR